MTKKTLQILMPMGGLGSRFSKEGYEIPKPLIEVDGKPMFMRALDSFGTLNDVQHIFVIRKEHDEKYSLAAQIRSWLPDSKIHVLDHNTDGAVATCLIAKNSIDPSLPIIIADCDIYFESTAYFKNVIKASEPESPEGMLLTFESSDARYSYAKVDETGNVVQTAEKIVISSHAILGGYFFKTGQLFMDLAETFINSPLPKNINEYYMSHLFNILLDRSGKIELASTDKMYIFGTPEELNNYLSLKVK